jgi:hypothetical protein
VKRFLRISLDSRAGIGNIDFDIRFISSFYFYRQRTSICDFMASTALLIRFVKPAPASAIPRNHGQFFFTLIRPFLHRCGPVLHPIFQ